MKNENISGNHFYVATISASCKKELQELSKVTPRNGMKIYEEGWNVQLKSKEILQAHIKKFDITKIMLYNTASPREIAINNFKKCFYISNKVILKENGRYMEKEYLRNFDRDDEQLDPTTLAQGSLLVCY